jgi:hypothetical protein
VWAMPLNIIAAFLLVKGNKKVKKYFFVYSLVLLLMITTFVVFPGMVNISTFPIIILLSYRSWMIGRNDKKTLKQ